MCSRHKRRKLFLSNFLSKHSSQQPINHSTTSIKIVIRENKFIYFLILNRTTQYEPLSNQLNCRTLWKKKQRNHEHEIKNQFFA